MLRNIPRLKLILLLLLSWHCSFSQLKYIHFKNPETTRFMHESRVFRPQNNYIYFSAYDSTHGEELWKADKNASSFSLVKDIVKGKNGCYPTRLTLYKNELYFAAMIPAGKDMILWALVKTNKGTGDIEVVKQFDFTVLWDLEIFKDKLYFVANSKELWVTDGSTTGTKLIKTFSFISDLIATKNQLFVNVNSNELWTISTGPETLKFFKRFTHADNRNSVGYLQVQSNRLYFQNYFYDSQNYEAWRTDGTATGTSKILLTRPMTTSNHIYTAEELYLLSYTKDSAEIVVMDTKTLSGTKKKFSTKEGSIRLVAAGKGKLYFLQGSENNIIIRKLEKNKITTVNHLNLINPDQFHVENTQAYGQKLFFQAFDPYNRDFTKIWEIDLTTDTMKCLNGSKIPEEYCSYYFIDGSILYYTTQSFRKD
jgi:ELWxxDGT repeat protein